MPSGGHGGGGGSHFGGGRSGGGRGGSGGGGSRRNVPMVFWFFGRRYYIPLDISNKIRNLLTLAFVTAFVFVCGMLSLKTEKTRLNTIVYDHDRYVKMIEFAKENPEYQAEGTITDIRYNGDVQKYVLHTACIRPKTYTRSASGRRSPLRLTDLRFCLIPTR